MSYAPYTAAAISIPLAFAAIFCVKGWKDAQKYNQPIINEVINLDIESLNESERNKYLVHLSYKECVNAISKTGGTTNYVQNAIEETCNPILKL